MLRLGVPESYAAAGGMDSMSSQIVVRHLEVADFYLHK